MKIGNIKYIFFLSFFLLFAGFEATGQFYNGLQMSFGKNRVQYWDFYWSYYRFEKFDTYFNEYGRELAEYTWLGSISSDSDHKAMASATLFLL